METLFITAYERRLKTSFWRIKMCIRNVNHCLFACVCTCEYMRMSKNSKGKKTIGVSSCLTEIIQLECKFYQCLPKNQSEWELNNFSINKPSVRRQIMSNIPQQMIKSHLSLIFLSSFRLTQYIFKQKKRINMKICIHCKPDLETYPWK